MSQNLTYKIYMKVNLWINMPCVSGPVLVPLLILVNDLCIHVHLLNFQQINVGS